MNKIKKVLLDKPFIVIGGTLVIGLLLGWLIFGGSSGTSNNNVSEPSAEEHVHKEGTVWTCSMHPQIREDGPGNCPICGMELIPLATEEEDDEISDEAVVLSASAMKIAEVETSIVIKDIPTKNVILPGMVKADERKIHVLTAHFSGRIEKLFVNYTGQKVHKGQVLATIFSPELVTTQKELFEAIKYKDSNPQFHEAARNKLKLWLFTDEQIDGIEQSGEVQFYFKILSPGSGTVTKRNIAQGDHVMEGMSMFQIIDLTHVWVEFDAYESDIPWVKQGSKAEIKIKSIPGRVFKSRVTFIDPVLNVKTRTTTVRTELSNKSGILRPGMFAQGSIKSGLSNKKEAILVPKSAVLWTGKKAVVYVKEDHGKSFVFHYRKITLGEDTGPYYVVAEGLSEGEEIVTNGAFKIDAAAQLQGKPSMMNPGGGKVSTGHNHGGGKMSDEEMENMDEKSTAKVKVPAKTPMDFKMQLGELVDKYLLLKNAFVKSDEQEVEAAAKKTLEALGKVDMTLLKGDSHVQWMKLQKPIEDNLKGIIQMKGIEMKRSHFGIVSDKLSKAIDLFGVHSNETSTLYIEFCPMAFNNKGASWISEIKEIKNPYFGEAMLTCGEVTKVIK